MEVRVSSRKSGILPPDLISDSEKKDISEGEDEDDDRNHKHRKREMYSRSLDGDSPGCLSMRPFRKRNKFFENGHSFRGGDIQSSETWKNLNHVSGREFPSRFEKRRPNQAPFSRVSMDLSQRISRNEPLLVEASPVRVRVREPGAWGLHDSRLDSGGLASQMVLPGSVPPGLFAMPNVSNAKGASWNAFGLVTGVRNGGLDAFHPLSLQAALGPPISSSVNIGIPRQRCRDFEELGFCLRGDLCPMEHGVNRIVIDDVQSLSQFNLPVSVPASQLPGTSAGQGALPVITAASGSIANTKIFHAKSSKPGVDENGLGLTGGFADDSLAGPPDGYDPDQPLWTTDNLATSTVLSFNQSNADKMESFMDKVTAVRPNSDSGEGFDEHPIRSAATAGYQSLSVWGRIGGSKTRLGLKEKMDFVVKSSSRGIKDEEALLNTDIHDNSPQDNQIKLHGSGLQVKELSFRPHGDFVRNAQNPSQKALRTLFVNGIPWKDNKREALLSHFRKFGQVIDIYIPMNSEKAFVQFLKREEAEAALKAPDAVMGNRFIKLWWANRDNVPDDGMNGIIGASHPSISDKGKENSHLAVVKDGSAAPSVSQLPVSDHPKLVIGNGPKALPIQQKKLENLELLKEELRKKQEMLDQKRNEFRRQLDKLEKQATGFKDVTTDQTSTRLKCETSPDSSTAETAPPTPRANTITENVGSSEKADPHSITSSPTVGMRERPSLRPSKHSLTPVTPPFLVNRFKLDNRPTAFKIGSLLPAGLANAATLEEHFSLYGDLSSVELEESQPKEATDVRPPSGVVSARISFTTRRSAEKAFLHGKSWRGHNLQFTWLTSCNESGVSGISSPIPKVPEETAPSKFHKGDDEPGNMAKKSGAESVEDSKSS